VSPDAPAAPADALLELARPAAGRRDTSTALGYLDRLAQHPHRDEFLFAAVRLREAIASTAITGPVLDLSDAAGAEPEPARPVDGGLEIAAAPAAPTSRQMPVASPHHQSARSATVVRDHHCARR
jgi:hypothetical protein